MEKVEEDLARSKNLREKQAKEFSRQLDELKIKHEKEVSGSFCVSHFSVSPKEQGDPSSQTPQETSMKSTRANRAHFCLFIECFLLNAMFIEIYC